MKTDAARALMKSIDIGEYEGYNPYTTFALRKLRVKKHALIKQRQAARSGRSLIGFYVLLDSS